MRDSGCSISVESQWIFAINQREGHKNNTKCGKIVILFSFLIAFMIWHGTVRKIQWSLFFLEVNEMAWSKRKIRSRCTFQEFGTCSIGSVAEAIHKQVFNLVFIDDRV